MTYAATSIETTKRPDLYSMWAQLQENISNLLLDTHKNGIGKNDRLYALVNALVGEIIYDEYERPRGVTGLPMGFTSKATVRERLQFVLDLLAQQIVRGHGEEGDVFVHARLSTEEIPDTQRQIC
jgi:hypothetical protein